MSDSAFDDLAAAVSKPDEELRQTLPDALAGLDDASAVGDLLLERPDVYQQLTRRVSTLDGIAEFASEQPETVDRFLTVLWTGQELISRNVPAVQEQITDAFSVSWACDDSAVNFHMETDPDAGTITGGPRTLDDADLGFRGPTDVLFSMLNDPEFDGVQAFMDGAFQVEGDVMRAQQLDAMMAVVNDHMRDLDPESAAL